MPVIANVLVPVPPVVVSDPKSLAVPCVVLGATNPENALAAATVIVTAVVFETVNESVAVIVSTKVPWPTVDATLILPVLVSTENPELGPLIAYLIGPVPVPEFTKTSVKVWLTPVVVYRVPNDEKAMAGLTKIVIGTIVTVPRESVTVTDS